jgi:glycosyltransferase involved in cell wall biosynthesis
MSNAREGKMKLSIIIPIFNEEENILKLYDSILDAVNKLKVQYELIFINDGSRDASEEILNKVAENNISVKVINFRKNFGQTAAMMAGINYASGDILIPMDGDLQNDPSDISALISKLQEGYDVVSGWRANRQDKYIRVLPSRIANYVISKISGVNLHDYGCTLKAYRADVIKNVRLYGEMHRFIPIYAAWQGGLVTEIVVKHHPRIHGVSKYGMNRIIKVLLDLIVVKFMADYSTKPIYIFGGFGFFCLFLSMLAGSISIYLKIFSSISFISTPLPLLAVLLFISGMTSTLMGLLAEIIMRTYHESQSKSVYIIKSGINI